MERHVFGVLIELSVGIATALLTLVELLTCMLALLVYQPPSIFAVNSQYSNTAARCTRAAYRIPQRHMATWPHTGS